MTLSIILCSKKSEDLEGHIDDLIRQKNLLQEIEHYTDSRIDFADVIETYDLLLEEIERLQRRLREQGEKGLSLPGKEVSRGEERGSSSFNMPKWCLKYYIGRS